MAENLLVQIQHKRINTSGEVIFAQNFYHNYGLTQIKPVTPKAFHSACSISEKELLNPNAGYGKCGKGRKVDFL